MTAVFLPGMDGDLALRSEFLERLSIYEDVSPLELPREPLGYDEIAARIIPQLPSGPVILIGESYSGPPAVKIAALLRDRATGLVLAASFVRAPMPSWLASLAAIFDHRHIPRAMLDFWLFGHTGTTAEREALHSAAAALDPWIAANRIQAALHADVRPEFASLACPILCLHGRYDRLIRPRLAIEMATINPAVRLRFLDAGHMLLETHAADAVGAIEGFCRSLP